jgi:predicted secreted protein
MPAVVDVLRASDVGIVQMPCPELHCLGLDRGNVLGGSTSVVEENTRIRGALQQPASRQTIDRLAHQVVAQIAEYRKHGFDVKGIVGINRSPSCGVETTSRENREVPGEGVFIEALGHLMDERGLQVECVGIKDSEPEHARSAVRRILGTE